MEENNNENKNNNTVNTDDILKETTQTFNQVKDQVKDSFKKDELKNSAKETTNFIAGMFKNPIGELEHIAKDSSNSAFKYAIILVVVWVLAAVIYRMKYLSLTWNVIKYILPILKTAVAPILSVLVLSLIVLVLNKKKDKSLVTIISTVTVAKLPVVIAKVAMLLYLISSKVSTVVSPFSSLCSVISIVLEFFACKFLLGGDDDKEFIKKFVIIEGIYYIAYIVLGLLEIYI